VRVKILGLTSGKYSLVEGVDPAEYSEKRPYVKARFYQKYPKSSYYDKQFPWETAYKLYPR